MTGGGRTNVSMLGDDRQTNRTTYGSVKSSLQEKTKYFTFIAIEISNEISHPIGDKTRV